MSLDDLMLDPIYDTLGTTVSIFGAASTSDTEPEPIFTGVVIDKTAGVEIAESGSNRRGGGGGAVGVPTVFPMMAMKAKDLQAAGLVPGDLINRPVVLNGTTWIVVNHVPRPGIFGEPGGQVYFKMRKSFDG